MSKRLRDERVRLSGVGGGVTLALIAIAISATARAGTAADAPLKILPDAILEQVITPNDYPTEALRRDEQGNVEFVVDVGTDGLVKKCTISKSSKSRILDAETCKLMHKRLRFKPGHDAQGNPVEDRFGGKVRWILAPVW